jgi:tetratricopeptide (TPR) repeat protein
VPEAHQEYLRGRYHWNQWTPDGFRRALEHFERAVRHDPAYAVAFSGLGDALGSLAYYGFIAPEDGFPRARAAATRAIELDSELADAHVTLGLVKLFWEWDWPGAEREIKKALNLNPKLSLAHSMHGLFLSTCGRFEEALAETTLGRDLEPLSIFAGMGVCWALLSSGRIEEGKREALRIRELMPGLEDAGNVLIATYEHQGDFEEAARMIAQQPSCGVRVNGEALLAAYRERGATGYWETRLELLEHAPASLGPAIHFQYAAVHLRLGKTDQALDRLERIVDEHFPAAVFLRHDRAFASLRQHPRFEALVARIGAPARVTDSPRPTVSAPRKESS